MHIEFKSLCNASKHMNMHISNAINQSSWACSPYLCASLVQEFWSFHILQCCSPSLFMSMSNLYFFVSIFPKAFISLYNLSPFGINFHKRCDSHWCKGLLLGRWLRLVSCIFLWTPLDYWNDTTCIASWDTTHRIYDHDTNLWDTSPYVIVWVIHLINLSSYSWGMHSSFDDHLWNHRLAWLIPRVDVIPLERIF